MKKIDYKSGQFIFKAGDQGKEIFLLMSDGFQNAQLDAPLL